MIPKLLLVFAMMVVVAWFPTYARLLHLVTRETQATPRRIDPVEKYLWDSMRNAVIVGLSLYQLYNIANLVTRAYQ